MLRNSKDDSLKSKKPQFLVIGTTPGVPIPVKEPPPPEPIIDENVTLDATLILAISKLESPLKVKEVTLESYNLNRTVIKDLLLFSNLACLDLGDNNLRLEYFAILPSLKELHLQCNGIQRIGKFSGFPELHTLNLSYNKLSASEITKLTVLPKLTRLELACNELSKVAGFEGFLNLQILNLDKNKLYNSCFSELAKMPKVRELNLGNNHLDNFPETEGFCELQILNLVNNFFTTEQDVMYIWELPQIQQVVLWGNPVRKAAVDGKETLVSVQNPLLSRKFPSIPRSFVEDLPKFVPKEIPESPEPDPIPPPAEPEEIVPNFFLTEVLLKNFAVPRSARSLPAVPEDEESPRSEHSEGLYDILYRNDDDDEDDIPFTGGIQAAVNALRVALKHPSMRLIQRPPTKASVTASRTTPFDNFSENIKHNLRNKKLSWTTIMRESSNANQKTIEIVEDKFSQTNMEAVNALKALLANSTPTLPAVIEPPRPTSPKLLDVALPRNLSPVRYNILRQQLQEKLNSV